MPDKLTISAELNFDTKVCGCCGKQLLKNSIEIISFEIDTPIYLGVTCAGYWFRCNLSGNPYKAIVRLNNALRTLNNRIIVNAINGIESKKSKKPKKPPMHLFYIGHVK